MANRPVFIPQTRGSAPVRTELVEFTWSAGLALSQKRKSIQSLHASALKVAGVDSVLEVSSKSPEPLGVALSAFNLVLPAPDTDQMIALECVFQGSKVFEHGGPYRDLFQKSPRDAKRDQRLQSSGRLKCFRFAEVDWGLEPQSAFYDWLYLKALSLRNDLMERVVQYSAFTDIEFNPERSVNCQAYSLALFVSLHTSGDLRDAMTSEDAFLSLLRSRSVHNARQNDPIQGRLF